jgi:hypothetical protein
LTPAGLLIEDPLMRVAQEAARQDVQAGVATVGSAYRLSGGSFGRTRRWRTTFPVAAAIAWHRCRFLIEELSVRDVKRPPVVGIEEDVLFAIGRPSPCMAAGETAIVFSAGLSLFAAAHELNPE